MDSGKQFGISFREQSKNIFRNKGAFGSFSREHGNTDPPGGLTLEEWYLLHL